MLDYDDRDINGKHGTSRGEVKIGEVLNQGGLPFQREYIFDDLRADGPSAKPLRFDFAVFDDAGEIFFLIEFQGEQHYSQRSRFGGRRGLYRQQYNDAGKKKYCAEHHLPLVVIPYWDYEKINYDYIMNLAFDAGA